MTFYLKYRSKNLGELDLEDVRLSLEAMAKSGEIPHALLFAGPKGTGKTSAARILAKILNCESSSKNLRGPKLIEPCNKCYQCTSITKGENLDVLELDAASHRGIDDVRSLREAVKLAPIKANKKIYIIDEAHMLTLEASNALLKTLEEPPEHVVFILATTNPEKLIETIRSRATVIYFNKAKTSEIKRSLNRVVKGEGLKVQDGVLDLIAEKSDGSFRDAIKILEQLVNEKIKLNIKAVSDNLSQKNIFDPETFIDILVKKETKKALRQVEKFIKGGVSAKFIISQTASILRKSLLAMIEEESHDIMELSLKDIVCLIELLDDAYSRVPYSIMEQIPLELAIIKWAGDVDYGSGTNYSDKKSTEKKNFSSSKVKLSENNYIYDKKILSQVKEGESKENGNGGNNMNCLGNEIWSRILNLIRPENASTEALLRASRPIEYDGKILKLAVYYKFHKEHLESNPHIRILEAVAEKVLGGHVKVICMLTQPPAKTIVGSEENKVDSGVGGGDSAKNGYSETSSDIGNENPDVVLAEGGDEDIIKAAKEIFGN